MSRDKRNYFEVLNMFHLLISVLISIHFDFIGKHFFAIRVFNPVICTDMIYNYNIFAVYIKIIVKLLIHAEFASNFNYSVNV